MVVHSVRHMSGGTVAAEGARRRGHGWRRDRPWTLRSLLARLCALAGAIALVVIAFGAVVLNNSRDTLQYRRQVLGPAATSAQTLFRAMLDQETGAHDYAITDSTDFLQPYDEGRAAQTQLTQQLRTLLGDDDELSQQLTTIERAADRWSTQVGQRQVDLVRAGRQDEAIALVSSGKPYFDDVRLALERLIEEIEVRRHAAAGVVDRRVTLLGGISIGGALIAAGASLGIWLLVRRSVSRPLDRLRRETSAVAGGQLDTPISRGGPVEIDELGRSVEEMRTMLLDEIHTAFLSGVIDAEAAERTRLANDLHDDPIQRLTALQWKLEGALTQDDPTLRATAAAMVAGLTEVQLRLRGLMFQLHPASIETNGLEAALDELILETFDGTDITWELSCDDTSTMSPSTVSMTYRFIAEALRNTRKHAQAASVVVEVHLNEGIAVAIVDDGLGFDVTDARDGGHRGIAIGPELAQSLGGWWRIRSHQRPDQDESTTTTGGAGTATGTATGRPFGTTVAFWLPPGAALHTRPDGPADQNGRV